MWILIDIKLLWGKNANRYLTWKWREVGSLIRMGLTPRDISYLDNVDALYFMIKIIWNKIKRGNGWCECITAATRSKGHLRNNDDMDSQASEKWNTPLLKLICQLTGKEGTAETALETEPAQDTRKPQLTCWYESFRGSDENDTDEEKRQPINRSIRYIAAKTEAGAEGMPSDFQHQRECFCRQLLWGDTIPCRKTLQKQAQKTPPSEDETFQSKLCRSLFQQKLSTQTYWMEKLCRRFSRSKPGRRRRSGRWTPYQTSCRSPFRAAVETDILNEEASPHRAHSRSKPGRWRRFEDEIIRASCVVSFLASSRPTRTHTEWGNV